jgi:Immunoglobulin domain/Immunoglobulin I-set domain
MMRNFFRAVVWACLTAAAGFVAARADAPSITQQPASVAVAPGGNATFQGQASGTAPLSFQWFFGSMLLSGATNASVTISNVTVAQVGAYYLVVTNAAGTAESQGATLDLTGAPAIVAGPVATNVVSGGNATFSVQATGTPPLTYQWSGLGKVLDGATNATLTLTNVTPTNAGPYFVVVSNPMGAATSTNAMLDVAGLPYITQGPGNAFVYLGENATFTGTVYSTTPVTYSWLFGSVNLGAPNTNSLVVSNVTTANLGYYYMVAANQYGGVESFGGFLSADPLPEPGLRLGSPTFTSNSVAAPVLFTAYGIETNVQFSVLYNASTLTNATFVPNTNSVANAVITSVPTNGALGLIFNLGTNTPFGAGETNLGTFVANLASPAANPYAAGLAIWGSPTAVFTAPYPSNYLAAVTNYPGGNTNLTPVITYEPVYALEPLTPVLTATPGPPVLNWQTGLFEQKLEVVNAGAGMVENVLVAVYNLGVDSHTNAIILANGQATLDTTNTVVSLGPLAQAETRDFTLEYYVSDRSTVPTPGFTLYATPSFTFTVPTTQPEMILTNRFTTKGFLIDFATQTNQYYYVEYAATPNDFTNISKTHIALPLIAGTGNTVQWLDNGPPKTYAPPTNGMRFYRILQITATTLTGTNIINAP